MANPTSSSRTSDVDLRDRSGDASTEDKDAHGRRAESPGQIPAKGWKDVAKRVKNETKEDNLPLIAGGVAFFGLLAIPPTLAAIVSIYGLVTGPEDIARHMESVSASLPEDAQGILREQLEQVSSASGAGLGISLLVSIALALWGASSAMKHVIEALSQMYDETEDRKFVALRGRALLLTVGGIVFAGLVLLPAAILPSWIDSMGNDTLSTVVALVRWPILAVMVMAGLAVLYRYAPNRDEPKWNWTSWGAVIATVIWLVASLAFSFYASSFGNYNKTYGSMAAVVVLMMWLWITALSILVGAQINAELEHQTEKDSTEGRSQPKGQRDAYVADHVGAASS